MKTFILDSQYLNHELHISLLWPKAADKAKKRQFLPSVDMDMPKFGRLIRSSDQFSLI